MCEYGKGVAGLLRLSGAAAGLLLCGCVAFYSGGDGQRSHSGSGARVAQGGAVVQAGLEPVQEVSFSVQYLDDFAPAGWFDKRTVEDGIQRALEQSGLFSRVRRVEEADAGERHCHFRVLKSGSMVYNRTVSGLACGLSLGLIPGWNTMKLEWDMSYSLHGRELLALHSLQEASELVWLPSVVLMPFLSRASASERMVQEPLELFVQQVRRRRLHEQS